MSYLRALSESVYGAEVLLLSRVTGYLDESRLEFWAAKFLIVGESCLDRWFYAVEANNSAGDSITTICTKDTTTHI